MNRILRLPAVVMLLVALTGTARAAGPEPADGASTVPRDPFAALHARLSEKADEVLLRAASSEPAGEQAKAGSLQPAPAAGPEDYQRFAERFWNGGERNLRRAVERVGELRPVVEPILRDEGLPPEALGLVLVESGGNPAALSPKGARGLWQFMPATARRYDLKVDYGTDDRLDVKKSTRAAARHLRDLHGQFGDWRLALAAYNAGERTVRQAVRRAGTRDFARLSALLPAETRAYVPAVQAAASLFGSEGLQELTRPLRSGNILYAAPAEGGAEFTRK